MFAIDGLANVSEPPPSRCPACQQTTSEEKCEGCGGPVFGLTARFREFVKHASTDKDRRTFANRLYDLRSAIAHRGELLREDEFDPASPQVGVTPSGNTAMLASHLRGKSFEAGSAHMSLGPSQAGVNNDNHSRFDKGASENAVPTVCGTTIRWRGPQILHILRVM